MVTIRTISHQLPVLVYEIGLYILHKCMCASMPALPVAQPVATDGACLVHLPSLPLSVEQTAAQRITLLYNSQNIWLQNIL